jgi:hypothetical protein
LVSNAAIRRDLRRRAAAKSQFGVDGLGVGLDPVVLDHDDVAHLPGPFLGQGDVDLGDLARVKGRAVS